MYTHAHAHTHTSPMSFLDLRAELEQERVRSAEYMGQMETLSAALAKAEAHLPMVQHDLAELKVTLDTDRTQVSEWPK